jgi:hypothetical protein
VLTAEETRNIANEVDAIVRKLRDQKNQADPFTGTGIIDLSGLQNAPNSANDRTATSGITVNIHGAVTVRNDQDIIEISKGIAKEVEFRRLMTR